MRNNFKSDMNVILADLKLQRHQEAVFRLLDAYMKDEMGLSRGFDFSLSSQLLDGLKSLPSCFVFLAEYQGDFIGMAVCFIGFSTFQARKLINIHDLIVLEQFRGLGTGRRILEKIEEFSNLQGFCKITLEVREDNLAAMSLYRKSGFGELDAPMRFWVKRI